MSTTTIKTTIAAGEIRVTSPYNFGFVSFARKMQGKWNNGAWVFPEAVKEHVFDKMKVCYGVDGTEPYDTCILCVKDFSASKSADGIQLFGRPIAKAYGRDSGAKIADDVFLIAGTARSGGSVKNWRTEIEDATFEIHNFPVAALEREDLKEAIAEGWASVKGLPAEGEKPAAPTKSELLKALKEAVRMVALYNDAALHVKVKTEFVEASNSILESLK